MGVDSSRSVLGDRRLTRGIAVAATRDVRIHSHGLSPRAQAGKQRDELADRDLPRSADPQFERALAAALAGDDFKF